MNTAELDLNLARFYVEARTKKGEEYNRSALLGFRNSIERYLNNNGCTVKISRNQVFQKSNKILDVRLRINRRAGKEKSSTQISYRTFRPRKDNSQSFPQCHKSSQIAKENVVLRFSVLVQAWKGGTARSSPRQFQVH